MNATSLVIIGGSAGSLSVLLQVLPGLARHLAVPVIIVLHRKNYADSVLTDLLGTRTTLQVKEAEEKDVLQAGCIYLDRFKRRTLDVWRFWLCRLKFGVYE